MPLPLPCPTLPLPCSVLVCLALPSLPSYLHFSCSFQLASTLTNSFCLLVPLPSHTFTIPDEPYLPYPCLSLPFLHPAFLIASTVHPSFHTPYGTFPNSSTFFYSKKEKKKWMRWRTEEEKGRIMGRDKGRRRWLKTKRTWGKKKE